MVPYLEEFALTCPDCRMYQLGFRSNALSYSGKHDNFTAPPAERRAERDAAIVRFVRIYGERPRRFSTDDTASLGARIDALLRQRDERPTTISE